MKNRYFTSVLSKTFIRKGPDRNRTSRHIRKRQRKDFAGVAVERLESRWSPGSLLTSSLLFGGGLSGSPAAEEQLLPQKPVVASSPDEASVADAREAKSAVSRHGRRHSAPSAAHQPESRPVVDRSLLLTFTQTSGLSGGLDPGLESGSIFDAFASPSGPRTTGEVAGVPQLPHQVGTTKTPSASAATPPIAGTGGGGAAGAGAAAAQGATNQAAGFGGGPTAAVNRGGAPSVHGSPNGGGAPIESASAGQANTGGSADGDPPSTNSAFGQDLAGEASQRNHSAASARPTVALGFDDGLQDWSIDIVGGSVDGQGSVREGSAILEEGDSFLVSLEREFQVPENPETLVFTYTDLNFDTSDPDSINDAFEAALVDENGQTLVHTIGNGRETFFNASEDIDSALGSDATHEAGVISTVALDVSHLHPGTNATLRFQLVNNDADTETSVRILDVTLPGDDPPVVDVSLFNDTAPTGPGTEIYQSDLLTNDPRVTGSASDDQGIALLEASIDNGAFVDITDSLNAGSYVFDPGTLAAGAHSVTIRATDARGQTAEDTIAFTVNAPPVPDAGGNRTIDEGDTVEFDGAGSTDAEAAIFAYEWGFHDGATVESISTSRTYPDEGLFDVSLQVTDTAGSFVTETIQVHVLNVAPTVLTATDLTGDEGESLDFVATFSDPGMLDTHTATVFWGDGTSSPGLVTESNGQGTVTASHHFADNGNYPIRAVVTDNAGDSGERNASGTIANVAPTVVAGIAFEPTSGPGPRQLSTVVSGHFTDPGYTRPEAGTVETFTVTVDWGDGTIEDVPATVTQGSDGIVTSGTFSANHVYASGGVHTVSVEVADDDGGTDSDSFTFGVARIDVVPAINLKSRGVIPVKVFSDPGFDASTIAVDSLAFGPGGAGEAHDRLHGGPGGFVMTHFRTPDSGIRPTDDLAFLTGELSDGTFFIGMDTIQIVPGSSTGKNGVKPPEPSPPGNTKFYVVDNQADTAFRYSATGEDTGSFALDSSAANSRGATSNAAGDSVWVIDGSTHQVAVHRPDGTIRGSWLAAGLSDPQGLATDGSDVWIVDAETDTIAHYAGAATLTAGVALASGSFALSAENQHPSGLTTDGSRLWVSDDIADQVFVYSTAGTLLGQWDLDPANADAAGITNDPTGSSDDLWVVDRVDDLVYRYDAGISLTTGSSSAADTFALAAGNSAPEGIADPQDYQGTEFWAGIGQTVGQRFYISSDYEVTGNFEKYAGYTIPYELSSPDYVEEFSVSPGNPVLLGSPGSGPVHITASDEISVVAIGYWDKDTTTLIPVDALGTEYMVMAWGAGNWTRPQGVRPELGSQYTIRAIEDDTQITITSRETLAKTQGWGPFQGTIGHQVSSLPAGVPVTLNADAGDWFTATTWYKFDHDIVTLNDVTGTVIRSNKPIIVESGHTSATVPDEDSNGGGRLFEQLPPMDTWGTRYFTVPIPTLEQEYTVRVLAAEADTVLELNGQVIATLGEGEHVDRQLFGPAEITASSPVLVGEYSHGNAAAMVILPPAEQYLNAYRVVVPEPQDTNPAFPIRSLNIVAPASAVGTLTVNDAPVHAGHFHPIGDGAYVAAQLAIDSGEYHLNAAVPFSAAFYGLMTPEGTARAGGFAYTAGGGLAPVAAVDSILLSTDETQRSVGSEAALRAVVLDEIQNPLADVRVDFVVTGTNELAGFAYTDENGRATFSYTGDVFGTDTISASVGLTSDSLELQWALLNPLSITVADPTRGTGAAEANASVLVSGAAQAHTPGARISYVTVNGQPVDVLDPGGHFFTQVDVTPGANRFEFIAYDTLGQTAVTAVDLTGAASAQVDPLFDLVSDVSASLVGEYARTSLNPQTNVLYADLAIRNNGQYPADAPLIVGVTNLSDPTVRVRGFDGQTPDGIPYFDFSNLIDDGTLAPSESTATRAISFFNPNQTLFTYDLVFLGKLNEAPRITSVPDIEALVDRNYTYDAEATDTDGDPLTYALATAPAGMQIDENTGVITWSPTVDDLGNHNVAVRVEDGRGGFSEQQYVLSAIVAPPNRPPRFTSAPVVDVSIGSVYSYDADADDADGDEVAYFPLMLPDEANIDPATGVIDWTPTDDQLGNHHVVIEARDGRGGVATQEYTINVRPDPENQPPIIVSEPVTTLSVDEFLAGSENDLIFTVPGVPGQPVDATFSWTIRNAGFNNEFGIYRVIDAEGRVDNLLPKDQGYAQAALAPSNSSVIFRSGLGAGAQTQVTLHAGEIYGFYIIQNSTTASFLANNPENSLSGSPLAFFSFQEANPDNFDHLRSSILGDGRTQFAWEDLTFGGDQDFTDVVFTIDLTLLPGARKVYTYPVNALDADGDGLTFSLPIAPTDAAIDSETGVVSWLAELGQFDFTVRVDDGRGGFDEQAFTIDVVQSGSGEIRGTKFDDQNGNGVRDILSQGRPFETIRIGDVDGFGFSPTDDLVSAQGTPADTDSNGILQQTEFLPDLDKDGRVHAAGNDIFDNRSVTEKAGIGPAESGFTDTGTNGSQWTDISLSSNFAGSGFPDPNGPAVPNEPHFEFRFDVAKDNIDEGSTLFFNLVFGDYDLSPANITLTFNDGSAGAGLTVTLPLTLQPSNQDGLIQSAFTEVNFADVFSDGGDVWHGFLDVDFVAPNEPYTAFDFVELSLDPISVGPSELEPGLENWTIYLDQNNNAQRDPGERFTATDADGNYAFTGLNAGTYIVREEPQDGWAPTTAGDFATLLLNGDFEATDFTVMPDGTRRYLGWTEIRVEGGHSGIGLEGINGLSSNDIRSTRFDGLESGAPDPYFPYISEDNPQLDHFAYARPSGPAPTSSYAELVSDDFVIDGPITMDVWREASHAVSTVRFHDASSHVILSSFSVTASPHAWTRVTFDTSELIGRQAYIVLHGGTSRSLYGYLTLFDNIHGGRTGNEAPDSFARHVQLAEAETVEGIDFGNQFVGGGENQPPVIDSPPPASAALGESLIYRVDAHDPNGDALTYDLVVAPDGMSIDPNRGILIWQPRLEDIGTHDVTIRVRDGRGGVNLQAFEITVTDNSQPVITSAPPLQASEWLPYRYHVRAQDADGDPILYRLDAAPTGMTIDLVSGVLDWPSPILGTHTVIVVASDGQGGVDTQTFDLSVLAEVPNEFPIIASSPREFAVIGDIYRYRVQANDPNGDPLQFSLDDRPDGMTITSAGLIEWVPAQTQFGPHNVIVRVEDGRGGFDTQPFTVRALTDLVNDPPQILSNPLLRLTLGDDYSYNPRAFDPDGDPLIWTLTTAPRGMSIDQETGAIRWTPTEEQLGFQNVEVQVVDGQGGVGTQTFQVEIRSANIPPLITSTPPSVAYVGETLTYAVAADDPDGWALSRLQYSVTGPDGMTISDTGLIQWTPTADQVGRGNFPVVEVSDGRDITRQGFIIEVFDTAPNSWPVVTSTPEFLATIDQPYEYAIAAFDPDGDAFSFQLADGPDGMTLVDDSLQWTPTSTQEGPHTVTVLAIDTRGGVGGQQYTVTAAFNDAPFIISDEVTSISAGARYRYDVQVHDPDGDAVSYALAQAPAGMTIDALGRIEWSPTDAEIGTHLVEIVVADGRGGEDRQSFDLSVTTDQTAPQVLVTVSENPVNVGGEVDIVVTAVDDVALESVQLTSNGLPVVLDGTGRATLPVPTAGLLTLRGTATDRSGNVSEHVVDLTVIDPTDVDDPVVAINSPTFGDVIEGPIDVLGTVADDSLLFYTLSVAPFEGGEFVEIARGTTPVTDGALGRFDPSTLSNDSYFLQLHAVDAGGNESIEQVLVSVAGELKVGNFTLSFTDLSIPVAGIPITVARTYDSLNAAFQSDIGHGWRLEFADTDLRTSVAKTGAEEDLFYNPYYDGARVFVTLPGGERQAFTFRLTPAPGLEGSLFGIFDGAFVPDPDVTSTLTTANATLQVTEFGEAVDYSTGLPWNPASPLFGGTLTLTTLEGIRYTIDGDTGDLQQVADRNGNTLSFSDDGIQSSTGQSVTFERDPRGRISAVIDPAGNRIEYAYDANGDLVSVTDRAQNETTMRYEAPGRPHFLTEIIDPLGRTGIRSEYDDQGRLISMVDADGKTIELVHDPDNFVETVRNQLGHPTVFEYDERGNVVTETDAEGGVTKRTYDLRNNTLSQITIIGEDDETTTNPDDPADLATFFTYDGSGNVLTETDGLGNVTRSTYDSFGNVRTTTDPLGNTTTNAYDANGNLLSITDPAGQVTSFTYDAAGNPLTLERPGGNLQTFGYDSLGNVLEQTDALGNVTTFTYDAIGNQLSETRTQTTPGGTRTIRTETDYDAEGRARFVRLFEDGVLQSQTETRYDALGNRIEEIDALGRSTLFDYDERGLLRETIFPDDTPADDSDNPRRLTEYDAAGQTVAEIDESGRRTEFVYDRVGRRIATIFPDNTPDNPDDNPRTATEYDEAGRVTAEIDERGNRTEFEYDAAGRQVVVRNALGHETATTYDNAGRQTAVTGPLGNTTRFVYDDAGRPVETLLADGHSMRSVFDSAGRLAQRIDQAGLATDYEYDALGRLTAVILPETDDPATGLRVRPRTEYEYDELGNLIVQRDALGRETRFEYDGQGRRTDTVLPLGQRSTSEYDAAGNLISATDFNGDTIGYEYDARNRLVARRFPDLSEVLFTYTPTGQRQSVTDARGTTQYQYDERNRLLARTDPDGVQISYTWDAAGNRTSLTVPSGTTAFTFDALNRLETVADPDLDVTRYTYDFESNLIRTEFPNGTEELRTYDAVNRLRSIQHLDPLDEVFAGFDYDLDAVGNRTAVTEHDGRRVEYDYDELYRLLREDIYDPGALTPSRSFDYEYDLVGNRLRRGDTQDGETTYNYDANDRLLDETTGGATTDYTYDANGNTLSKVSPSESVFYDWDFENRLIAADTNGDGVNDVAYQYDADGIRVSKTLDPQGTPDETRFLVDKNRPYAQVLEEYTPGGIIKVSYVHGLDLISQKRPAETGKSFYHVDGLGSTRALTDAAGVVTDRYIYDAYGRTTGQVGATGNVYLFAGEQRDVTLGLDYLRARWMNPSVGRFASRDTYAGRFLNPITQHRHLYANANPVLFTDPSGRLTLTEYKIVTAIIASLFAIKGVVEGQIESGTQDYFEEAYEEALERVVELQQDALSRGKKGEYLRFLQMEQQLKQALIKDFRGVILDSIEAQINSAGEMPD